MGFGKRGLFGFPCCWFMLGAFLFTVAYCQAPLYYSNQNQYFLHGFAQAGIGFLNSDWLANTLDPTPVFSSLVAFTLRFLRPWLFYLYYGVLFGIYAASMVGLFAWLVGAEKAARRWPIFVVLFFAVHAALPRWCAYHWLGRDYPWYFQGGVAGQYLLGCMFQPSTFGVLLVAAICFFARNRIYLAGACVALAATFHSTYLLPGGLLTMGFLLSLAIQKRARDAVWLGIWTLALVLPVTLYVSLTFAPTSPELFAAAQEVLVNVRIPHHARPDLWLDRFAVLQCLWILTALVAVRRTVLIAVLAVPLLLAVLLTMVQVLSGSPTLALLFSWRMSTVLVPIATTLILSRLAAIPAPVLDRKWLRCTALASVAVLVAGGAWISLGRLAFRSADEELAVMEFVRRTRKPGEVYYLPVRDPKMATTIHGAQSTDFKPLQERRQDNQVIPVDFQRFRLATGAAIYVEFKAIPYKDVEVLEWHDRLDWAEAALKRFQGKLPTGLMAEFRHRGVSHLVLPAGVEIQSPELEKVHGDAAYQVYRLTAGPPS